MAEQGEEYLNRNIITAQDVAVSELGGRVRGVPMGTVPGALTTDDFWARLLKQVPAEVLSAYLIVDGLLRSGISDRRAESIALAAALVAGAIASFFFARNVLDVARVSQAFATAAAFAVAVFAIGGWFGGTSWYQPWMGSVAVVVFALYVRIAKIPPLPPGQ